MQQRQDLFLQNRLEVDQQIAATDQVHMRERRIGDDVLSREDAHVAERLADAVTSLRLDEEAAQSLRRDVLHDILRVEAGARYLNAPFVEVGDEHLDGAVPGALDYNFR